MLHPSDSIPLQVTTCVPSQASLCPDCAETVAMVVHDFGTPLTALRLNAQLLQRHLDRIEPTTAHLIIPQLVQSIVALSVSLELLADDLFASTLPQPRRARNEPYDLIALLRQVVGQCRAVTAAQSVRLITTLGSLMGTWPPSTIERIMTNLLANAGKYSPAGSAITLTIEREDIDDDAAGQSPRALVTLADEGIGIPAQDLPVIFERGRRGENAPTTTGGTGLGLANVQALVAVLGGSIQIASRVGVGTRVTVGLPLEA
jgi:signal transduction histidine kinase